MIPQKNDLKILFLTQLLSSVILFLKIKIGRANGQFVHLYDKVFDLS